jgi:transposase-like protein
MRASRKVIPADSLFQLRQRLDRLPPKSPERAAQVAAVAQLYGVSSTTVYRALKAFPKPRAAHRTDRGTPRVLPRTELEHGSVLDVEMATFIPSVRRHID